MKEELKETEVLVVLEIKALEEEKIFEGYVTSEGFKIVEGQQYAYSGKSATSTFPTKAYILEVFTKGLLKCKFDECSMIFQIGDTPWQAYKFDKNKNEFEKVK